MGLCIPHNFKTKEFNYEIYAQPFFIKILHRKYRQTSQNIFNRLKRRRIDKMDEFNMPRFCNNLHGDPNLLFHLQMPNNMFEYMS